MSGARFVDMLALAHSKTFCLKHGKFPISHTCLKTKNINFDEIASCRLVRICAFTHTHTYTPVLKLRPFFSHEGFESSKITRCSQRAGGCNAANIKPQTLKFKLYYCSPKRLFYGRLSLDSERTLLGYAPALGLRIAL